MSLDHSTYASSLALAEARCWERDGNWHGSVSGYTTEFDQPRGPSFFSGLLKLNHAASIDPSYRERSFKYRYNLCTLRVAMLASQGPLSFAMYRALAYCTHRDDATGNYGYDRRTSEHGLLDFAALMLQFSPSYRGTIEDKVSLIARSTHGCLCKFETPWTILGVDGPGRQSSSTYLPLLYPRMTRQLLGRAEPRSYIPSPDPTTGEPSSRRGALLGTVQALRQLLQQPLQMDVHTRQGSRHNKEPRHNLGYCESSSRPASLPTQSAERMMMMISDCPDQH